jgi:hypothetical protein
MGHGRLEDGRVPGAKFYRVVARPDSDGAGGDDHALHHPRPVRGGTLLVVGDVDFVELDDPAGVEAVKRSTLALCRWPIPLRHVHAFVAMAVLAVPSDVRLTRSGHAVCL